jgi:CubicO group peptidase (beta-lactamase class C family)
MKTTTKSLLAIFMGLYFILFNLMGYQPDKETPEQIKGYSEASYKGLNDNEFLKNWLILGPVKITEDTIKPDNKAQKEAFDKDYFSSVEITPDENLAKIKIGEKEYSWKIVKNPDDAIDLNQVLGENNFAIAYAMAEIKMEAPAKILAGVGSDDGIKIFLNGKLVHENWIPRGVNKDDDIVSLNLKKGSNQILLKVQNMEYGWGFTIRPLGENILNDKLLESSGNGNLDNVRMLLENGVNVNATNEIGLSAFQNALIRGREDVTEYLKEKGADTLSALPEFKSLTDNIFKSAAKERSPGVAVLVSRDGEIIYENSFGYADIGNKVPVIAETKFRIGSITKQFTAAGILKLQEEGKITVNDSLSEFIPDFPRGNEVTIHHLLTHTSGIHSFTNRPNFMKYVTMSISPEAMIDTIKNFEYDFDPGERYQYNNSGYYILGYIIEKVSGKEYGEYLKETFFDPLGMKNTGVHGPLLVLDNEATGYSLEEGTLKKAINWDMTNAGGAGALYSTVNDLYIWNEALFKGKVLSDESLKAAFTPVVLNNNKKPEGVQYGYGWLFYKIRGIDFTGHGGGLHGFLSSLSRQPENNITIAVLCNSTPPPEGINPGSNANLIAEYLLWQEMEKQSSYATDTTIDISLLEDYTGRYNYGRGAVLIVSLENGKLYAQLTGQSKFQIFPSSENEFYWKVVEASVKFIRDDNGKVTHAIHNQGGQQLEAEKLEEETPVEVAPGIFDKYTGKYDYGNYFFITITKEDDKLYLQGTNLPKYQLLPASETEFFLNEMNTRIIFQKNEEGQTDSILVNIDGIEKQALRIEE